MTRNHSLQAATVNILAASVLSLAYSAPPPVGTPWEKCREQARSKAVSTDTWLVHDQEPLAAVVAPAGEEYEALRAADDADIAEMGASDGIVEAVPGDDPVEVQEALVAEKRLS